MSDTRLQTSIIEAIQIITDKKVSQASFDKTIKAIVKQVVDQTIGEYLIRYQDSEFIAYATSAEIYYKKGDQVFILIPGNDWSRVKTIIGGTNQKATTFVQPPAARNAYNTVGRNGVISVGENLYPLKLNSYENTLADLYNKKGKNNLINIDEKGIINNIKENGGFVVGAYFKTQLDDSQIGGDYGLIFNLQFSDSTVNNSDIVSTKPYILNSNNVIGNPYLLRDYTYVNSFIDDINVDQLVGIQSIQIYCTGFNIGVENATVTKINPEEQFKSTIYVKDIQIQAIESLTTQELNGYSLNIDCSNTGNILGSTTAGDVVQIQLNAELKSKGKVVSKDVEYYWFRQNGSIFRGNKKYSSYGGDGWECLNWLNQSPVPYKDGKMIFCGKETQSIKDRKIALIEKNTRIKCVATYKNLNSTSKEITLINNNINENIIITSSDKINQNEFKTIYYLDNGHPTLTCEVKDNNGNVLVGNLSYEWYQTQSNGISKKSDPEANSESYNSLKIKATTIQDFVSRLAPSDRENVLEIKDNEEGSTKGLTYQQILDKWKKEKNITTYIDENKYVNFPINSILNSKKISCVVYNNETYIGTASITLYNKQQLAGMYSVVLNNGSQVFHYDGKGNSPASPQIERPLQIQPLTFGLLDKDGTQIPFEQIIKNGQVKWIISKNQTLLIPNNNKNQYSTKEEQQNPKDGMEDLDLNKMTLPLAANNYNVYKSIPIFYFSIANQYNEKNIYNDILLHIKYKDLIFDTYTNFSFPKQGDPGTNGTDYVAKIVASNATDRIYISNRSITEIFDDNGASVSGLNFQLYDNSRLIPSSSIYWNCPPVTQNDKGTSKTKMKTYLSGNTNIGFSKPELNVSDKAATTILSDKPVNIIRAQYGGGRDQNSLSYFAQYPVCTEFVNLGYRLKVKPKTGFKYAVYLEDGTRPDYDNSLPFEIIVQHVNGDYWQIDSTSRTYTWYAIGNVELNNSLNNSLPSNKRYFKPKNNFNGDDLTSAVLVQVSGVGRIHIPIYMCLNRYGHAALNGWDGNSIQLNGQGDTILAPQVGAGKKQGNNTFTGILMGNVKTSNSNDTGLFGYYQGARTIFMDANSGKTVLGKDKTGQVIIDPSSGNAKIHSGNYSESDGTGMQIDLSDPHIKFGSGHFKVDSAGNLTAKGDGSIAGWTISDNRLYKKNTGMASSDFPASSIGATQPSSDASIAFYASNSNDTHNFYVTHDGYLFSKSGKIGGWSIGENTLSNDNVGMNSDPGNEKQNNAFYAGSNFYVTHSGYLFSKSGNIAGWEISKDKLEQTDNKSSYIGMGDRVFFKSDGTKTPKQNFISDNITARFWSANGTNHMFLVDYEGQLFSNYGLIGGWTIGSSTLEANKIIISSKGYIQTNPFKTKAEAQEEDKKVKKGTGWSINKSGNAIFNNIQANEGTIGDWYIRDGEIRDAKKIADTHVRLYKNDKNQGCLNVDRGEIGGWTIGESTLTATAKGQTTSLTINSNGSLTGPNWSIKTNGDAVFNRLSGTLTGQLTATTGGISGNGGNWSMPGDSAPSWKNGEDVMTPTTIKTFTKLTLKKQKHIGTNPWHVVTEFTSLGEAIDFNDSSDISVTGVTSITGKDSLGGAINITGGTLKVSIKIPKLKKNYSVVKKSRDIGSNGIVTGWGEVTTDKYSVMASSLSDAEYGDESE